MLIRLWLRLRGFAVCSCRRKILVLSLHSERPFSVPTHSVPRGSQSKASTLSEHSVAGIFGIVLEGLEFK